MHIASDVDRKVQRVAKATPKLNISASRNSGVPQLESAGVAVGSQNQRTSTYRVQQKNYSLELSEDQRSSTTLSDRNVQKGIGRTAKKGKAEFLGNSQVLRESGGSHIGSYKGSIHEILGDWNLDKDTSFMEIHGMKFNVDCGQDDARNAMHQKSSGAQAIVLQNNQVPGIRSLKLHSLGMINFSGSLSSKESRDPKFRSGIGSSHPLSDWRGLLSAILSLIQTARGAQVCLKNSKDFGAMNYQSASKFYKGTHGSFLRVDWAISTSVDTRIRIQPFLDSRIRFQDNLEEAIGWRKHIFDRG